MTDRPNEEAIEEYERNFPPDVRSVRMAVCEDCFRVMTKELPIDQFVRDFRQRRDDEELLNEFLCVIRKSREN